MATSVELHIKPQALIDLQGSFGHTAAIHLKESLTYSNLLRPTGLPNVFLRWVSWMPNGSTAPISPQQCQCSTTHLHINTITCSFARQSYISSGARVRGIHHPLINALAMGGETSADIKRLTCSKITCKLYLWLTLMKSMRPRRLVFKLDRQH